MIAPATPATYTATHQQAPAGCTSGQWKASYFANQTLSGAAAGERCEAAVDYNWGLAGPTGVGVGADNFSVRWVKTQSFAAGTHTFTATTRRRRAGLSGRHPGHRPVEGPVGNHLHGHPLGDRRQP